MPSVERELTKNQRRFVHPTFRGRKCSSEPTVRIIIIGLPRRTVTILRMRGTWLRAMVTRITILRRLASVLGVFVRPIACFVPRSGVWPFGFLVVFFSRRLQKKLARLRIISSLSSMLYYHYIYEY